ncbi:PREDICTED: cuticular protein 47Eg-like [Bactrocera latifrons]|uniref:cuticular protein 47Eg-like n=1 Tax=Bactrocera latifrons TaxID=174628 RepID=UPI0008DDC301|nr:PREDICTED: cuticular protein 47Eg-like [Bactrocera latifrons]
MKFFVVLACFLAVAYANEEADVLRLDSEVNPDSFKYAYEFSNSIKAEQEGVLSGDALIAKGQYSYTSPEGEAVAVQYVADENGYQVVSANPPLPTPPPIPEAILKAIAYIEAHPPKE